MADLAFSPTNLAFLTVKLWPKSVNLKVSCKRAPSFFKTCIRHCIGCSKGTNFLIPVFKLSVSENMVIVIGYFSCEQFYLWTGRQSEWISKTLFINAQSGSEI